MAETKIEWAIRILQRLIDLESVFVTDKAFQQYYAVPESAIRRKIEKLKEEDSGRDEG